ncbi:MAG: ankyrin repeat domain-containing protein [Planctomycetota bacterium]|jgi:ankyrin repeat protein
MRLSLHTKLAIFVLLLFAVIIAGMFLYRPYKIFRYSRHLASDNFELRYNAVEKLIKMGKRGRQALIVHFSDGEDAGKLLISHWDNINKKIDNKTTLFSMLNYKWEYEPDLKGKNCTLLHFAVMKRYHALAGILLKKGASTKEFAFISWVNEEKRQSWTTLGTPMHQAALSGNLEMINLLYKYGAAVNADWDWNKSSCDDFPTNDRRSPLHFAACHGHADAVLLLIEKGARVNARDCSNASPLHKAACSGSLDTVKILIGNGAEISPAIFGCGWTPLHEAVSSRNIEVVKYLVKMGANPKTVTNDSSTMLHAWARGIPGEEVVDFLIEKGVDINAVNKEGDTAVDIALEVEHGENAEILRSRGGRTAKELQNIEVTRAEGCQTNEVRE